MTLFLILISLVVFSLIANLLPQYSKIFILISILVVFFFYFFLSKNFFYVEHFYPKSNIQAYIPLGNYYNLLLRSLKNYKLYIVDDEKAPSLQVPNIYENYKNYVLQDNNMFSFFDTSFYKGKIYLYFGITPVLLFYAPFNFVTNLYLTDKMLVFILSCLIFILSLILLKKITGKVIKVNSVPENIRVISVFFIGICSFLPFLLIKSNIYEVAITTAIFLLLVSFYIFYYYINTINTKNSTKQNILIFFLSMSLCLTVGARPHCFLFIPIFFCSVVGLKYINTKSVKNTIYSGLIFLIPCLIYGMVIALYNYLRFDSIFEFGWKYQLNDLRQYDYVLSIKDSLLALKYNLFQIPGIDANNVFSLVSVHGHRIGNEFVAGIVWMFPLIFILFLLPKYLREAFVKDKNAFYITIFMMFVIIVNLIVTSFIGMITRYFFEYMLFCVILSMILFYYLYDNVTSNRLKKILNIFFILMFVYSAFINVSLLFCENNALFYARTSGDNYISVINFLFK